MGYRVSFSLGTFPITDYIYFLKEFYDEFQKYEIEIVDGIDFKASKYFDIPVNSWKLDKLVPSVLEAHKLLQTIKRSGQLNEKFFYISSTISNISYADQGLNLTW